MGMLTTRHENGACEKRDHNETTTRTQQHHTHTHTRTLLWMKNAVRLWEGAETLLEEEREAVTGGFNQA